MSELPITVIFMNGFMKYSSDWNITPSGRTINIEHTIKMKVNTMLISLTKEDYENNINEVCKKLILTFPQGLIILIGHSFGYFYAMKLAQMDHHRFHKLLLIEPVVKSPLSNRK